MLHEVLLSLAGHPSPLFDSANSGAIAESFPLITPPELALLAPLGDLSRLHRNLRSHTKRICSSHASTICRAVASSISSVHLARFQQKILEVEARILTKDAGSVAAYDIAPLAGIVGEFDEWKRRMEWYWDMTTFMLPASARDSGSTKCTGADIINRLRKEAQTGYPDLEHAALELAKVAETAWLRLLSSWVLHGRLPPSGAEDFFVKEQQDTEAKEKEYLVTTSLIPVFVNQATAASILFIGKILNQISSRGHSLASGQGVQVPTNMSLLPEHLKILSSLELPLAPASLSSALNSIRSSLSQKTLQRLLPLPKIKQLLSVLEDFFLLRRGEFATALIAMADQALASRGRTSSNVQLPAMSGKSDQGVRSLVLREAELGAILNRVFAHLTSLAVYEDEDSEVTDSTLELARSLVELTSAENVQGSSVRFTDVLLPLPTALTISSPPPFDLFLTPSDISAYSQIHAYLLAIRRGHAHLISLWRLTPLRRDHPAPAGPPYSASERGRKSLAQRRDRSNKRGRATRRVWATCSKAVFFFSELTAFFEGVIIRTACEELSASLAGSTNPRPGSSSSTHVTRPDIAPTKSHPSDGTFRSSLAQDGVYLQSPTSHSTQPHSRPTTAADENVENIYDPTVMASLHSAFISTLSHALLLSLTAFTSRLKQLLTNVEGLVGQVTRLQAIQSSLDLEEDEGVVDALNDWRKEERACLLEVDRARKKIDEGLRACLDALNDHNAEGSGRPLLATASKTALQSPELVTTVAWNWRPPPLDRLLMKLEFGKLSGEGLDDDDDDYA